MSSSHVPMRASDPRRVCLIHLPKVSLGPRKREILVYLSGALFAIGWWFFLDATILSSHAKPIEDPNSPFDPVPVHVTFADWTPAICSTLGMIIVNLIDKQKLQGEGDDGAWEGSWGGGVTWRARLFLFLGFALMAGGLAGSVTVLVIKYVIPNYPEGFGINYGAANVVQSIAIMMSAIVLWLAQNSEAEYDYQLTL